MNGLKSETLNISQSLGKTRVQDIINLEFKGRFEAWLWGRSLYAIYGLISLNWCVQ